jgi:predicted ABC-type ATPase
MAKIMRIVAGPPGSGKSCAFPVAAAGFGRHFNADDEAMLLNHGSYQNIPIEVRRAVNARFEEFINDCIAEGDSFTFETTLRTTITFDQARRARANGFFTYMRYLGAAIDVCIERVKIRADADGHSAPESFLRATYAASMKNLVTAIREMDRLVVLDSTRHNEPPDVVLVAEKGSVTFLASPLPRWFTSVFADTGFGF